MPADVTAKARWKGVKREASDLVYESEADLQLLIDTLETVNRSIQAPDLIILQLELLL